MLPPQNVTAGFSHAQTSDLLLVETRIGVDASFVARLPRAMLLAPDIVEAIPEGEEPSGLSLTMRTEQLRCFGKPFSAILRELKLAYPGKPAPTVVPAGFEKIDGTFLQSKGCRFVRGQDSRKIENVFHA